MNYYDSLEKKFKGSFSINFYNLVILILPLIVLMILWFHKMYLLALIPMVLIFLLLYVIIYRQLNQKTNFFNIIKNYMQYKIEKYELKKQVLLNILRQDNSMTPEKIEHMLMHYRRQEPISILSGSFTLNLFVGLLAFYSVYINFLRFDNGIFDIQYFQIQFSIFVQFILVSMFIIHFIRSIYYFTTGKDSKKELVKIFISILEDSVLAYDTIFVQTRNRRDAILRHDTINPQRKRTGNRKPST